MHFLCNSPKNIEELDKIDLINEFRISKTLEKEPHCILKLTPKKGDQRLLGHQVLHWILGRRRHFTLGWWRMN